MVRELPLRHPPGVGPALLRPRLHAARADRRPRVRRPARRRRAGRPCSRPLGMADSRYRQPAAAPDDRVVATSLGRRVRTTDGRHRLAVPGDAPPAAPTSTAGAPAPLVGEVERRQLLARLRRRRRARRAVHHRAGPAALRPCAARATARPAADPTRLWPDARAVPGHPGFRRGSRSRSLQHPGSRVPWACCPRAHASSCCSPTGCTRRAEPPGGDALSTLVETWRSDESHRSHLRHVLRRDRRRRRRPGARGRRGGAAPAAARGAWRTPTSCAAGSPTCCRRRDVVRGGVPARHRARAGLRRRGGARGAPSCATGGRPGRLARPDASSTGSRTAGGRGHAAARPARLDRRAHRPARRLRPAQPGRRPGWQRRAAGQHLRRRCCSRGPAGPRAALNLGGIANLTVVGARGPLAYDLGPANALVDAATTELHGEPYDADGRRAAARPRARGPARRAAGRALLRSAARRSRPARSCSTGTTCATRLARVPAAGVDDVIATVTELTARDRGARAGDGTAWPRCSRPAAGPQPAADAAARRAGRPAGCGPSTSSGCPSDAKEAYAFALMGFLTVHGLPGTVPSCTGAAGPRVLGLGDPGGRGAAQPGAGGSGAPPARRRRLSRGLPVDSGAGGLGQNGSVPARVIVLAGPSGSGKSRLAERLAPVRADAAARRLLPRRRRARPAADRPRAPNAGLVDWDHPDSWHSRTRWPRSELCRDRRDRRTGLRHLREPPHRRPAARPRRGRGVLRRGDLRAGRRAGLSRGRGARGGLLRHPASARHLLAAAHPRPARAPQATVGAGPTRPRAHPGASATWCADAVDVGCRVATAIGRTTRSWPRTPATGAAGVDWPADLRPAALSSRTRPAAAPRAGRGAGPPHPLASGRSRGRHPGRAPPAHVRAQPPGPVPGAVAAPARHPALGGRQRPDGAHGRADRHGQRPPATPRWPTKCWSSRSAPVRSVSTSATGGSPATSSSRSPRPRRRRTPLRPRAWRPGHRPPRTSGTEHRLGVAGWSHFWAVVPSVSQRAERGVPGLDDVAMISGSARRRAGTPTSSR